MIISCNPKKKPDTSKIGIEVKVVRFEKAFFEADTNDINSAIEKLRANYQNSQMILFGKFLD